MERDAERAAHIAARMAQARLAAKLKSIAAQATSTRSTGFRVPVVDADPDASFPTNLWGFDDGRIRWRGSDGTVHELLPDYPVLHLSSNPAASTGIDYYHNTGDDSLRIRRADGSWAIYNSTTTGTASGTTSQGGSTTRKPKQADPAPSKHRQTWGATWGKAFNPVRGPESGAELHYGRYDSTWGNRRVMIGFNDAAIRSALAGAEIKSVELHMTNTDSWSHSGIDVHFGAHNRSSAPGGYSSVRRNAFVGHWPETGDGTNWRSVSKWFGTAFRDNTIKGLTIDQPDGVAYYGAMRWASVQLRITWIS